MMSVAQLIFTALVALTGIQLVCTCMFVRLLVRSTKTKPTAGDVNWPRVAILLPLRGADPKLLDGLRSLMSQSYADYQLYIVVDSRSDSAWPVVEQAIAETNAKHVQVSELVERRSTCSRQCSAFLQAAKSLAPDRDVVITVDGDTAAHPTFLRELVAPLLDKKVGATFGNRWFMPPNANCGSLVRYLWNTAAVVAMYFQGIPWGGCMALRRSLLDDAGLLDAWATGMVQDAPVKSLLARLGLSIRFVPTLMMVNRDLCYLPFTLDFLKRQMLWTRLYHPNWLAVLVHGAWIIGVQLTAVWLCVSGLFRSNLSEVGWAGAGLAAYFAGMLVMIAMLEMGVRCVVQARGEATAWLSLGAILKLLPVLVLTQLVHTAALLMAQFSRAVTWRGVTYKITSPFNIQVVADRPMEQKTDRGPDANVSL